MPLCARFVIPLLLALSAALTACSHPRDPAAVAKQYDKELVRRPGAEVDDLKVYFIEDGKKRWVTDKKWIIAHGYHWPADVNIIPADDLAIIPAGDELH